jgi:signal transduction histidine kinase
MSAVRLDSRKDAGHKLDQGRTCAARVALLPPHAGAVAEPGGLVRLTLARAALASAILFSATHAATQAADRDPHRVLVLYENESTLAAVQQIAEGLERGLSDAFPMNLELYTEYLDTVRFPAREHADSLADTLGVKYRDVPPNLVIAVGPGALRFWSDRLPGLHDVPLVFGAVRAESAARETLPPDAKGVVSGFDLLHTLELARRLQPDARRLVVLTGSSEFDRSWEATARADLAGRTPGLEVNYVSGLSLDGFRTAARDLDRDTILMILTVFEDAEGRNFIPRDAAAAIAAASGAPSYSVYSSYIGAGVVGGYVQTFQSIGETMARLAAQALSGEAPAETVVAPPAQPVVDWRQMKRWGMDTSLLPPGAQRLFYEPSAWERYRFQILLAAAVILLQSATIAALFVQDRRRRRIAEERAAELLERAHLSRASQLGALSGALAHELNQPLTAILANAEAGAQILTKDPPDLDELAAILADISDDDRRAAAIIAQLRRLLTKGDAQLDDVDLNEVVAATVALARSELVARQTVVDVRRDRPKLPVRGNLPQLQQVVLNLVLNAAEAMADLPPQERRITIETTSGADGSGELSVSDRGPGLNPELRTAAFKPFVTSKPNGLGFGLSICRSIAQAHGGTLAFDEAPGAGARIILRLQPA